MEYIIGVVGPACGCAGLFSSGLSGSIAQSVEQRTENPCVVGSIPTRATFSFFYGLGTFHVRVFLPVCGVPTLASFHYNGQYSIVCLV